MSNWDQGSQGQFVLPKPGRGLIAVMAALFLVWLLFAIAVNWGGAGQQLFYLFCGSLEGILQGEIWRLFTAPFMHAPQGTISHILVVLLGLYFLTPNLEHKWGEARLLRFLFFSALIAYSFQLLLLLFLPSNIGSKLAPGYWFGAFPVVEAVAIAWALSFRGQTVRLMFVVPISSRGLVIFVVAMSVLRVVALSQSPEGLLSPFGGMLAGWLLGGGTPSPLRQMYLKFKLRQVEHGMQREKKNRQSRVKKSSLSVIEGGKSKDDGRAGRGPDGNWLN